MANREEAIEQIARDEVYPSRYDGKRFNGEWPSAHHHKVCLAIAEDTYRLREAQTKREAQARKREEAKKNELDQRERTSSEEPEQQGD